MLLTVLVQEEVFCLGQLCHLTVAVRQCGDDPEGSKDMYDNYSSLARNALSRTSLFLAVACSEYELDDCLR